MKLLTPLILSIFLISCSLNSTGDILTVEEKALISLMVQDYSNQEMIVNTGNLESDDYNEIAGSYVSIVSNARSTVNVSDEMYLLDDGTEVYIVKELNDKNTFDDSSDDVLTVTRSYFYEDELWKSEQISRPAKPETDWDSWEDNQLVQQGTIIELIGDLVISSGIIEAIWALESEKIVLRSLTKITFNIVTNIKRITEITYAGDTIEQSVSRYFWNGSDYVLQSSWFFELIDINGEMLTKLIKDDGSYIIIRQKQMPQIREFYDENNQLYMVETIGKQGGLRSEVTREFYEEGTLVWSKFINISYKMAEDSVQITREVDSMERKFRITISIAAEGYRIERNGFVYQVILQNENTVLIYSENGVLVAEIRTRPDDSATVIDDEGTATVTF
jgi:hypothetical protein